MARKDQGRGVTDDSGTGGRRQSFIFSHHEDSSSLLSPFTSRFVIHIFGDYKRVFKGELLMYDEKRRELPTSPDVLLMVLGVPT